MICSLSHTINEIKALVEKLIDKDIVRQKAITELAAQFDNTSKAKEDLRKAYEKCNDISQENRALIDTYLKKEFYKDYEMQIALSNIIHFHINTMANEQNEVRYAIIRRLRTEQEKELQLVNNFLGEMTRYLFQKLSRAEEETRVRSLPLEQPLNSYVMHILLTTSESDMHITTALVVAIKEVPRCIDEKQELINNY
uniref:Uncharacterized protein n=1 Tax=Tanacetum cinerariifolium TaxID=118510 RepID=A0A6L2MXI0_TANCI|nr:hypothetical protein [Tanacetum cinerariifolium]